VKGFETKRDKPDFAEVYERDYSYVYNHIYMQVMHRENTEDLVSDVFMKAMAHYDGFDPAKASTRTWLCTIARNCLIDYFRKNGRRKTENLEDAPEPSAVDEYEILKNPINKEVYRLLEPLSQEERELLTMIYVQELKNPQIGEILGINAKAVSERHRRLLAKLRAMEAGRESGDFLDFS
jgi:RNA polymerase sigma-70 factor (ECF subfamily)